MIARNIESKQFYHQEEEKPFQLLLLPHIEGRRKPSGTIEIDVYPDEGELMSYQFLGGNVSGNPLLENMFRGQNPHAPYLQDRYTHLTTHASPQDIVWLATPDNPVRWNGAGGIMILRDKYGRGYLPLNIRSGTSGYYHGKIDGNGGLSGSLADWLAPNLLGFREVLEEVLILKGNERIVPVSFDDSSLDANVKLLQRLDITSLLKRQTDITKPFIPDIERFDIVKYPIFRIIPPHKRDRINVHYRGLVISSDGIINVDPAISSIDLRQIYEVPIDSIDDITIIDGEDEAGDIHRAKDRTILLFDVSDILELLRSGGTEIMPYRTFKSGRTMDNKLIKFVMGRNPEEDTIAPALARMLKVLSDNSYT